MGLKRLIRSVKRSYAYQATPAKFKLDGQKLLQNQLKTGQATVIQVGANGGTVDDPLTNIITHNSAISAYLIEPLPYYCGLLRETHRARQDRVRVINTAISDKSEQRDFYYVDEAIADEMDGEGPPNKWAHGQGSFTKDTIIYWIQQNRFRGPMYVNNIDRYLAAIKSIRLQTQPLSAIIADNKLSKIDALIIDVQGHELPVLQSCDLSCNKPQYILYEDDLQKDSLPIARLLLSHGYRFVGGNTDKLWQLAG